MCVNRFGYSFKARLTVKKADQHLKAAIVGGGQRNEFVELAGAAKRTRCESNPHNQPLRLPHSGAQVLPATCLSVRSFNEALYKRAQRCDLSLPTLTTRGSAPWALPDTPPTTSLNTASSATTTACWARPTRSSPASSASPAGRSQLDRHHPRIRDGAGAGPTAFCCHRGERGPTHGVRPTRRALATP